MENKTPTALDIKAEANKINVTPEMIATLGKDDARLTQWRVGPVMVVETNGNSVWEDCDGFTELYEALVRS